MKSKKTSATEKRRRSRSPKKKPGTEGRMECLCLECGISNYMELEGVSPDSLQPSETRVLANIFCEACGGALFIRGRAGDEPCYPVG
jgi:hypothetical protein